LVLRFECELSATEYEMIVWRSSISCYRYELSCDLKYNSSIQFAVYTHSFETYTFHESDKLGRCSFEKGGWRSAIYFQYCLHSTFSHSFSFFSFLGWRETESTWYVGHYWPIVPARLIDDDECGAAGGMRIGRGNRSTRNKPFPVPLCPPQIPYDLTWARSRAAVLGSRRLTA
jgi:hypothetical protein